MTVLVGIVAAWVLAADAVPGPAPGAERSAPVAANAAGAPELPRAAGGPAVQADGDAGQAGEEGRRAPSVLDLFDALEGTDVEGRRWGREELAGRVVLVDFWATWCPPCLAELPRLRRLHERHGDGGGLRVLGVCLDGVERREVLERLRRHRVSWPQIHESGGFAGALARGFGVESLPRSFLFDRQGRLLAADLRGEALEAVVEALLSSGDATLPEVF